MMGAYLTSGGGNGVKKEFATDTPQGISAANIFIFPRVLHSLIK